MKKLLILFIFMIMLVNGGGHMMILQASSLSQDGINASLIVGHDNSQPQAAKVFSVEDLDNYIYEYHHGENPIYFDKNKYDESFFEDKFLYFSHVLAYGSSPLLEVTSINETIGAIEVEITRPALPVTPDMASWILVLEMDRVLVDKEISVTTVTNPLPEIKNVEVVEDDVTVELNRLKLSDEVLIVAVYDTNGKMLSMSPNAVETEIYGVYDISVALHPTDAKEIKVMWWDGLNTIQPLCKTITKIKNESGNWITTG